MAKTETLLTLVKELRAELRHEISPNLTVNTEERFRILLNNIQDELFLQYDWDDRKVYRYIAARAGERYYDFPKDLDETASITFEYKWNTVYLELTNGISRSMLAERDNERGERSDPVLAWQIHLDDEFDRNMFEVWPVPSVDGQVNRDQPSPSPTAETPFPIEPNGDRFFRIRGIKKPTKMVEDSDRCVLDARLIVLFAAANEATAQGSANAPSILQRGQARLRSLQKNLKKTTPFKMGTDLHLERKVRGRSRTVNDIRFRYAPNT